MTKFLALSTFFCFAFSSCYIVRAYRSRNFKLQDLPKVPAQTIAKSSTPFYFKSNLDDPRYNNLRIELDTILQNSQTYSFTVIKNDTIIYDRYFDGLTSHNIFPSFSVAKSFVGTLVQIAHQEGKIQSLQEPITNYLPYLLKRDKRFANITIQHLLDMRSGIYSNENYNSPFSDVIKLGFRSNIQHQLKRLKIAKPPGEFEYISVNTQLLGMIIQQASGKKLYDYLQEKIWQPLGMEADATWNIDSKKHRVAKAFCCLNAQAHDFVKLGRLYLNNGNWNGVQLLDSAWVNSSISSDSLFKYDGYRNQWWQVSTRNKDFVDSAAATAYSERFGKKLVVNSFGIEPNGTRHPGISFPSGDYEANGLLEQYIYVDPIARLIIVRTGHDWETKKISGEELFRHIKWMSFRTE